RFVGLAVELLQHAMLLDIDVIPRSRSAAARQVRLGEGDEVADLPLQGNVADQAVTGFGIDPGCVSGVRIAVRVAVGDVIQEDEVVAVADDRAGGERGHCAVSLESLSAPARRARSSLLRNSSWR